MGSLANILSQLFVLAIVAGIVVFLIVAVYMSSREWSVLYFLEHRGEVAEADIFALYKNTKTRSGGYFITYRFDVAGVKYEQTQQISKKHFKRFAKSDRATIQYFANRPAVSRLAGKDFDNTYRNFITYIAFAGVMIIPALIPFWIVVFIFNYLMNSRS